MSDLSRRYAELPTFPIHHAQFTRLPEYSASMPTGVFVGKMWRRVWSDGHVILCGYVECDDPTKAGTELWRPRFVSSTSRQYLSMRRQHGASLIAAGYRSLVGPDGMPRD